MDELMEMEKPSRRIADEELSSMLQRMFVQQDRNIDRAVRSLKVIAHPARLRILCVLGAGEHTVQEIEKYVGVSQSTLSQHLSLLKDRGVLVSRREGNYSHYSISDPGYIRLFELIKEMFCQ